MEFISDKSCEPMDIDLSSNSVNAMDISYIEDDLEPNKKKTDVDDCLIIEENVLIQEVVEFKRDDFKRVSKFFSFTVVMPVLIAIISVLCIQMFNSTCKDELDLTTLKKTLSNKIHGQPSAIEKFIKGLEYRDSKMLVLYGGTGVGKTYMISLMLNNIVNFTNIYHYTMPIFSQTFATNLMQGLILCKSSIVIIDDADGSDHTLKPNIEKLITKSQNLGKQITVILIYNCNSFKNRLTKECHNHFKSELESNFKDIHIFKSFIQFEPLAQESLKKCIQSELNNRIVSDRELLKIMNNFNVEFDGCKGVHQKVKYYNVL